MNFSIINQFFLYCCQLVGENIFLGIIVFTLATKILLFPISLWCHWNTIVLLRLLPDINTIKVSYFGDEDFIAQKQRELFKLKHYNPFLGFIPLIFQILLLLITISAINSVVAINNNTFAGQVPIKDGNYSFIMPIFAAISSVIFGLTQNYQNPIQREQSKKQQFITNGFSILLSLFLGFIVPVGVAFYWGVSNILSILIQEINNRILNPKDYVNYFLLRRTQLKLQKHIQQNNSNNPELKLREKNDYKRFFSVANKHLVFYSEASGFYKYFKLLIEYLLNNSNVIIHYVTSDPNDKIFELAQTTPAIKPYYIGKLKLITLFMKMDADIVVMTTPDLDNLHLKRSYLSKDIEYIYLDHAISSLHMTYREHAFDNFDTIFCVCQNQVDELKSMEKMYGTNPKNLVNFGYPLLDTLISKHANKILKLEERKKILIAPSWQQDNIFDKLYQEILPNLAQCKDYHIILRAHPEYIKRYPNKWKSVIEFCENAKFDNVEIEQDFSSNDSIFTSDLIITDWSGIAYEFAYSVLKPVLFINTPMKIINPNYKKINLEPINITMRNIVGIALEVDEVSIIGNKVAELLFSKDKYEQQILAAREKYVFNVGNSGMIGGKYILKRLIEKQNAKKLL